MNALGHRVSVDGWSCVCELSLSPVASRPSLVTVPQKRERRKRYLDTTKLLLARSMSGDVLIK